MLAKWFAATKVRVAKEVREVKSKSPKSPKSPKKKEGKKKEEEEKKDEKKDEKKEDEKKEEVRYFGIRPFVSDHADLVHPVGSRCHREGGSQACLPCSRRRGGTSPFLAGDPHF